MSDTHISLNSQAHRVNQSKQKILCYCWVDLISSHFILQIIYLLYFSLQLVHLIINSKWVTRCIRYNISSLEIILYDCKSPSSLRKLSSPLMNRVMESRRLFRRVQRYLAYVHNTARPRAEHHGGWLHLATYNTQRGPAGRTVRPDWTRSQWSLLILCSSYCEQRAEHKDTTHSATCQWSEAGSRKPNRKTLDFFLLPICSCVLYYPQCLCAFSSWN